MERPLLPFKNGVFLLGGPHTMRFSCRVTEFQSLNDEVAMTQSKPSLFWEDANTRVKVREDTPFFRGDRVSTVQLKLGCIVVEGRMGKKIIDL
ncbi:hypothetical protein OUZ56_003979 [Daphnia magna]|uniref:Uncharacterized protein n=1 Tax=Daphnia magna TaxID=35525 RepID=A0ABQ9YNE7_9CRUS|nr:hypothetical protein OUZ56_003979 [Daphnia magna]